MSKIEFEIEPREVIISNEYVSQSNKQKESRNHGQSKIKFKGDSLFFRNFQKQDSKNLRGKYDTQDNFSFKGEICFYKKHVKEFIQNIKIMYENSAENYKNISLDTWKKYSYEFNNLYSQYNDNDLITEVLTTASYRYHEQGLEYQLYKEILFKISIPYSCKLVFYKIKKQGKILVIPKVDFALLQQSYFVKLANKSKKSASIAIRKYQSQYRDKIIARDKMCVITNIETLQVCEASHLKPYCRCTAKEQSNPINGILLSATFHKFLDEGLISFDPNTGKIILSRFLPTRDKIWLKENTATFISLKDIQEIENVYKNMKHFIKYHYDHVFLSD